MKKSKILAYTIGPVGSALLGFISLPLIAWFFPMDAVGKISMFQAVASLCTLLFCLGLDQAYVREYHECKNLPQLLKLTLIPGLLLLLLSSVTLFLLDPVLTSLLIFEEKNTNLSVMTLICFIAIYISRFLSLVLRMQERALAYSMSQVLPKLLFILFVLSGILLSMDADLQRLLMAYTLSFITVFLIYLWNTRRDWRPALAEPVTPSALKPLLLFALPLVIGSLASWGLNVADKIFLRYLSNFNELGLYSVAVSLSSVATLFAGVFNTIWAPQVYKWISQGNVDVKKIDTISEHLLAAIFFAVVLCGAFSWIVPYMLPASYGSIKHLLPVCFMAPLLYTLSETTAVGISIARKTVFAMFASVLAMLFNIAGNYLLVPIYGAAGAVSSTLAAFMLFYVLRTEFSKRLWRKMPTKKTYLIILILFAYLQINTFFLNSNIYFYLITAALLTSGLFIFWRSITVFKSLLLSAVRKGRA